MMSAFLEEGAIEAVATCLRCGGLMVSELGFDIVVQRCVQCGERVDAIILENRRKEKWSARHAGPLLPERAHQKEEDQPGQSLCSPNAHTRTIVNSHRGRCASKRALLRPPGPPY